MKINLFFMHGFLGLPEDWNEVLKELSQSEKIQKNKAHIQFYLVDYMKDPELNPQYSLENWGKNFNAYALKKIGGDNATFSKNILIGYSLGGRLSLHAFFNQPENWDHLICLSTHPGMDGPADSTERKERFLNDQRWGKRFENDAFSKVLSDWNQQSVLKSIEVLRNESSFDKKMLSQALTQWSLSQQIDFSNHIHETASLKTDKITWVIGNKDEKFVDLSKKLKIKAPFLNVNFVSECGHRLLFENPELIGKIILKIILKVI